MNTFGKIFRITTFGESHGKAIGVIIDGCPAGLKITTEEIQKELDRRKPGQSAITSQRKEKDTVQIVSGIFNNITLGTPISLLVFNEDTRPEDYSTLQDVYRPSHADFSYQKKYGIRDYRGGGRSSARETLARVAAGSIAKKILSQYGMNIFACVTQVGNIQLKTDPEKLNEKEVEKNIIRCPDPLIADKMIKYIEKIRKEGDSIGGCITCVCKNIPSGLGEPVFDKLQADLAKAMLSINAVHGFEYGSGFRGSAMKGSEHNDQFSKRGGKIVTLTNNSGGIQGGISNGQNIYFRVAFKPTATIMKESLTVDSQGKKVKIQPGGRHDPCVLPRAVPIVEAMTAIVLADHYLRNLTSKIKT